MHGGIKENCLSQNGVICTYGNAGLPVLSKLSRMASVASHRATTAYRSSTVRKLSKISIVFESRGRTLGVQDGFKHKYPLLTKRALYKLVTRSGYDNPLFWDAYFIAVAISVDKQPYAHTVDPTRFRPAVHIGRILHFRPHVLLDSLIRRSAWVLQCVYSEMF